jgi:hypothetical protein
MPKHEEPREDMDSGLSGRLIGQCFVILAQGLGDPTGQA